MAVQGGEELVQHQQIGPADQDAGQGRPLGLPAGELGGPQLLQPLQAHHGHRLLEQGLLFVPVRLPAQAAQNVLGHRHIGEQGVALEQVAHPPPLGGQVDALFAVEQGLAVQDDTPPVGPLNAGNAFEGHALAAARGAQQAQHAALGFKPDLEEEAAQILFNVYQKAHRRTPVPLRFSMRLTTSSTAAEIARLTITQAKAPASSLVRQSW